MCPWRWSWDSSVFFSLFLLCQEIEFYTTMYFHLGMVYCHRPRAAKAINYGLYSPKLWAKEFFILLILVSQSFYYDNRKLIPPIIYYHSIFQSYNSLDICSSSIQPSELSAMKTKDLQLKSNNLIPVTLYQKVNNNTSNIIIITPSRVIASSSGLHTYTWHTPHMYQIVPIFKKFPQIWNDY